MKTTKDWAVASSSKRSFRTAAALRAAERRGFKRAVKMLRAQSAEEMHYVADWLEEQRP
jgi:hypothetical protein